MKTPSPVTKQSLLVGSILYIRHAPLTALSTPSDVSDSKDKQFEVKTTKTKSKKQPKKQTLKLTSMPEDDLSNEYEVKTIYTKRSMGVKLVSCDKPDDRGFSVKWPELFSKFQYSYGPHARAMIKQEKVAKGHMSIVHHENSHAIGNALANNLINPGGIIKFIPNNDREKEVQVVGQSGDLLQKVLSCAEKLDM